MKHKFLSLLLVLVMLLSLVPLVHAEVTPEVTLTFAEAEQTIFVGKTKSIKPILENYKKKATYSYTSEDKAVATVNSSGMVKGIAEGTTTITCVGSTPAGDYKASYSLTVLKAITSISLGKSITMATDTTYALTATIKPENATVQTLIWSSSKESVATVDENGVITAHAKGTATITAAATDGSKKKVTVTVTVKEYDVVIKSKQGADVTYSSSGTGMFLIDYKSKNGCVDGSSGSSGSSDAVHLEPLKAGTDTFTISVTNFMTRGTKRYNFNVYVTQNAMDFTDDIAAAEAAMSIPVTE